MKSVIYKTPLSREIIRFRRMSPERRVNLALEMSSTVANITLESIKNQNPHISTTRLLEVARKRFRAGHRGESSEKRWEDIRAILANTRVNKRKIIDRAREEGTIEIFREIIRLAQTQRKGNRAVRLHDNSVKTPQGSERGSLPKLKPFIREKHDRFD